MVKRILTKLFHNYYQRLRIFSLKILSTNKKIIGNPKISQPVLFLGLGKIEFCEGVNLGIYPSPFFFDGSIYIEARSENSIIKVGKNTFINISNYDHFDA